MDNIIERIEWCDPPAAFTKCSGTVGVRKEKHLRTLNVYRVMVIITLQHYKI